MTLLLLYAYCVGIVSSRQIERACYENLVFRMPTANHQPDNSRISEFRRHNLDALKGLFVLRLCQKAGMVRLGHVALNGIKVQANASKRKAMSLERMLRRTSATARGSWAVTCRMNCGSVRIAWRTSGRPAGILMGEESRPGLHCLYLCLKHLRRCVSPCQPDVAQDQEPWTTDGQPEQPPQLKPEEKNSTRHCHTGGGYQGCAITPSGQ